MNEAHIEDSEKWETDEDEIIGQVNNIFYIINIETVL